MRKGRGTARARNPPGSDCSREAARGTPETGAGAQLRPRRSCSLGSPATDGHVCGPTLCSRARWSTDEEARSPLLEGLESVPVDCEVHARSDRSGAASVAADREARHRCEGVRAVQLDSTAGAADWCRRPCSNHEERARKRQEQEWATKGAPCLQHTQKATSHTKKPAAMLRAIWARSDVPKVGSAT